MRTDEGSTSVSSHWNRPPFFEPAGASKSMTTATTGGLRLKAKRSTVNVAMVACTSAMRTISILSMAPPSMLTRDGGRCTKPPSSRDPNNAYFHAADRSDGGAAGRSGSGRLGGSRCNMPRHVRKSLYDRSSRQLAMVSRTVRTGRRASTASVTRSSHVLQPSASCTMAMSWPGVARFSTSANSKKPWATPVLPNVPVRSSTNASGRTPNVLRAAFTARVCRPVTMT